MKQYEQLTLADGTTLDYALVLPEGYVAGREVPVLLAFPPGGQTRDMVEAGLNGYWQDAAQRRGWVVISPVAPNGRLFFRGSEQTIPELLDEVAQNYPPENGRFHIAGISNGGISAFRVALEQPHRFQSMQVLPGVPGTQTDFDNLDALSELPVAMYVGEQDTDWLERMQQTSEKLEEVGAEVSLEIVPGEGHVIQSLSGERLFDFFEAHR